jgi:SAM-dependent methyltransferase
MDKNTIFGKTTSETRDELLIRNIIHDFSRDLVIQNLKGCYGSVTRCFYRKIIALIAGQRILDAGCGFGLFSKMAIDAGLDVVSIDIDEDSLDVAREVYGIPCLNASVYRTPLNKNSRDVLILMDAIQHLDLEKMLREVNRLGIRQVVIGESNESNPLLKAYRKRNSHQEAHNYSVNHIRDTFRSFGFNVRSLHYENFVSLPCSGGLQRNPLPLIARFPRMLYWCDRISEYFFRAVRLDAVLAFRYIFVFEQR